MGTEQLRKKKNQAAASAGERLGCSERAAVARQTPPIGREAAEVVDERATAHLPQLVAISSHA